MDTNKYTKLILQLNKGINQMNEIGLPISEIILPYRNFKLLRMSEFYNLDYKNKCSRYRGIRISPANEFDLAPKVEFYIVQG